MTRAIVLRSWSGGPPAEDDFAVDELELPAIRDGQILVRGLFMSAGLIPGDFMPLGPYARGRTHQGESYPPFELGEPLHGGAIGEVVETLAPGFPIGDIVTHDYGWREHAVLDATEARKIASIPGVPLSAYLGVLGMPGLAAYVGLLHVAALRKEDAVFVAGAAGAAGGLAGQIARLRGASRVVGSAGSDAEACYLVQKLGFDDAFNYKVGGPVAERLERAAPDGIDVYFGNACGEHLEAAIGALRRHGRAAMCGAVWTRDRTRDSTCDSTCDWTGDHAGPSPAPRNLSLIVGKRLSLCGFLAEEHLERMPDMTQEVGAWLRAGEITLEETIVDGLENAPGAFIGMLRGENPGKVIVRLA
jgi:NADPH-dependent curcumin reductase CurA